MHDFPFPNNSQDLTGQVAFVTGATSGLGWHFSRVLASAGAKVAIAGRRKDRLAELEALIKQDGGECASFILDMTDADAIVSVVADIEQHLGLVTILVNNAGIPDAQLATKMDIELIDRVLDTNVRGPFILSREVAKRLIADKKPGRIINIASMAAYQYDGNGAALYSVSKAAIARMTEALSVEWAKFNINVNAIAPGVFASEMVDGMQARMGDLAGYFPRKRIGSPSQLDSTLLFLSSPASECVTGTIVKVDDGQSNK
ncbi:MAG: NAD(P)-dependent dehydrogenase (short-subunit alcohol dehydrogenase family) [Arenicella sp.]|jgi:NAD(P)-dependent dehydrogenase (short-subunit alcohol dehydrogenase family)